MSLSTPSPRVVRNAAALIIGTEILSGKIRDENLYALTQTLRALGIELQRAIVCPDDSRVIETDIRSLLTHCDVIFTSGGVGPTHDDVTMSGIAAALGVEMEISSELAAIIRSIYGDKVTDNHLLMARVPRGAQLAETDQTRWPTVVADKIWILPGVPQLFRAKLDVVRKHLRGPQPFFTEVVYCSLEEAEVKDTLDSIVAEFGDVELGSYPKWFDSRYKTKLTLDARTPTAAQAAAQALRSRLGKHVVTLA